MEPPVEKKGLAVSHVHMPIVSSTRRWILCDIYSNLSIDFWRFIPPSLVGSANPNHSRLQNDSLLEQPGTPPSPLWFNTDYMHPVLSQISANYPSFFLVKHSCVYHEIQTMICSHFFMTIARNHGKFRDVFDDSPLEKGWFPIATLNNQMDYLSSHWEFTEHITTRGEHPMGIFHI